MRRVASTVDGDQCACKGIDNARKIVVIDEPVRRIVVISEQVDQESLYNHQSTPPVVSHSCNRMDEGTANEVVSHVGKVVRFRNTRCLQ